MLKFVAGETEGEQFCVSKGALKIQGCSGSVAFGHRTRYVGDLVTAIGSPQRAI
jgi:hypothetical protein